jgi:hypothetical protein
VVGADIFKLVKRRAPKKDVTNLVQYYRQLIRDYCDGDDEAVEKLEQYKKQNSSARKQTAYRSYSGGTVFAERYNSCGFGVGYESDYGTAPYGDTEILNGKVSFKRLAAVVSQELSLPNDLGVVTCPGNDGRSCGKIIVFSKRDVRKNERIACPCGACAKGCDADSIAQNARRISLSEVRRIQHKAIFFKAVA